MVYIRGVTVDALDEFRQYIEGITGKPVACVPLPEAETVGLPMFLPDLYRLETAEFFGRRWVLAVQRPSLGDTSAPSQWARHVEQIARRLAVPVALVLTRLTPYIRLQLMRRGVPFVAPGRQVFLPMAWVDLRERYPSRGIPTQESLSAPAQVVVLYHLQKAPVRGLSLRELAGWLGYSAMTLSKAADELTGVGLCEQEMKSRSRMLRLVGTRRELWDKARPHLLSPVRGRQWVRWAGVPAAAREAGLTALARLTMINDDPHPTYAIRTSEYRRLLEAGRVAECPGPDDATAQVECWAYDPGLMGDEGIADRLSLVLSMADSADERVQKALDEVEAAAW